MPCDHSAFNDQISDEELAHIWTLNPFETEFVNKHQFQYKLHVALQLCSLRKYGRFLEEVEGVSTKVLNYLTSQIGQGASFKVNAPSRRMTYSEQCQEIIQHLGFRRPSIEDQNDLSSWLIEKAEDEIKADRLIEMAEEWLLDQRIVLPTKKVLKRLVGTILSQSSQGWFNLIYQKISEQTREHLDLLTLTSPEEPKSLFAELKDSPSAASIGSINIYLDRFEKLKKFEDCEIDLSDIPLNFVNHCHELAKRYDAWEIKRFYRDLEDTGFIEILSRRYRGIRKYFPRFVNLPFEVEPGNEDLLMGIDLIRKLDKEDIKKFPVSAPTSFIDFKLHKGLYRKDGSTRRSVWEIGLAIAIKDKFRSGDIYLPQSKRHTSFWNLIYSEKKWEEEKPHACKELHLEADGDVETQNLADSFESSVEKSQDRFKGNKFAKIEKGKLKLRKDDKLERLPSVDLLQNTINASLPRIRIEDLIVEVDKELHFSRHFNPIQGSRQATPYSYKSVVAAIIAMATNLGIIAMSNSTDELSVDILRDVVRTCIREETIKATNAEIVNAHTKLPLSSYYGSGELSSSDGQNIVLEHKENHWNC